MADRGCTAMPRLDVPKYVVDMSKGYPSRPLCAKHDSMIMWALLHNTYHEVHNQMPLRRDAMGNDVDYMCTPFCLVQSMREESLLDILSSDQFNGDTLRNFVAHQLHTEGDPEMDKTFKDSARYQAAVNVLDFSKLPGLFDDQFHNNYCEMLLKPICDQNNVEVINPYYLKCPNCIELSKRNFQKMLPWKGRMIGCKLFVSYVEVDHHFIGVIISIPETLSEGFVLVLNPMWSGPDSETETQREQHRELETGVKALVDYILTIKMMHRQFRGAAPRAPDMRIVYVGHPPGLTQKNDLCCSFWCFFLIVVWLQYLRNERVLQSGNLACLRFANIFPEGNSVYDFRKVNRTDTVDPLYSMSNIRSYLLLLWQFYLQMKDLAKKHGEVIPEDPMEAMLEGELSVKRWTKFNPICKMNGREIKEFVSKHMPSYVLAGSHRAVDHYHSLSERFQTCDTVDKKLDFLNRLPDIDVFRIMLGMYDDKRLPFRDSFLRSMLEYSKSNFRDSSETALMKRLVPVVQLSTCRYSRKSDLLIKGEDIILIEMKPQSAH
jgi:hypothetical protein